MRLATTTADFHEYTSDTPEILGHLCEAGFRYIDYSFGLDCENKVGFFGPDPAAHLARVKAEADRLGLQLVQSHAPAGPGTAILASEQPKLLAQTRTSIQACAALGIPNIVVHSGYEPHLSRRETFARNREFYLRVLEMAEPYNITVLTENFNGHWNPEVFWIDDAPDLLELLAQVNHPLLQIVWDTGHGNMRPKHNTYDSVTMLGSHLRALHVHDNLGHLDDNHMAPFFGSLSLDALMNALLDMDYQGYFTMEACHLPTPNGVVRTPFARDTRLARAPLAVKKKSEELLFVIGKEILGAYNCYEE